MRLLAALLALSLIAGGTACAESPHLPQTIQARSAKRPPQVVCVYTMNGCPPCVALENHVAGRKVEIKRDSLTGYAQRPCLEFPTVLYADKTTDNGQKLRASKSLPKSILFIKWVQ
jgi:hypothetical protein